MSVELYFNQTKSEVTPGRTLFEYAEDLGVRVPSSCRKQGKCKECLVEVVEGMDKLSHKTSVEKHLKDNYRLSCRTTLVNEGGLLRCHTMRRGEMKIEGHAFHLPASQENLTLDPAVTRDGDRILLDGQEIDRSTGPIHGLAMDLGTTTVVLRLLNLETGRIVASSSFENPQRFGGSDIMSRIQYDHEHGGHLLQRTLAGYISHVIEEFPVPPDSIYEMVVAGNSTMRDLFFRLSAYSIGQTPYQSITEQKVAAGLCASTNLSASPAQLGIPIHPKGRVYGLPIISGHVGADAAACLLALNLAQEDRLVAIMDVGTNTELMVGNRQRILAASCPAGPAFEGGVISCGMPGLPGAIEAVELKPNGSTEVVVIGGAKAEGICGSGLIELLSELVRTNQMNSLGRLQNDDDRFVLCSGNGREISLAESDVNELAQAKGANVAGLRVVFDNYGKRFQDIDVFYLAGGFGKHLNVSAARRIGLIPNIPDSKIRQVGNASIEGACLALLSLSKREALESLVRRVEHCRLETHPRFFDYFVEGCQFKPVDNIVSIPAITP